MRLVHEAPASEGWLHEIKYDGYRIHARIGDRKATLLARTGLDWSHRYRRTIEALREAEEILDSGCVAHNLFWFAQSAIDHKLTVDEWDEVARYARRLDNYICEEPLA